MTSQLQRKAPLASRGYLEKLAHVLMKNYRHGYDGRFDPKLKSREVELKRRVGD